MKKIIEKNFNKILNGKEFQWSFNIKSDGLYSIEIVASCKNWRQNLSIQDDDLAIKIGRASFPHKKNSKKLFDGEAAWNGNNLKGLKKTGLFVLPLKAGKHTLTFLIYKQPFLESVHVFQIEEKEFSYLPQDNPPEDGNRRQWLAIAFRNIGVHNISIEAQAKTGKQYSNFLHDDADLKIVIDGIIQKNLEKKSHKNWYWCGRALKGETKQFSQQLDFQPGLHYLEFYADRSPVVQDIALNLGDDTQTQELFLPKAHVIAKEAYLRQDTNTNSDILHTLKKDEQVSVSKGITQGEAPYKEKGDFTNTWHKVKYQGKIGYVFAKFLEIEGEDKETIQNKIIATANKYEQDPCLMLAIAQRESQFFPYAVSKVDAQGLFQMTSIAVRQVQDKFDKKEIDRFSVDENVEIGILYFKYLKDVYQNEKDPNNALQQQLAAWNRGQRYVPSDIKFYLKEQPGIVQIFIKDVLKDKDECSEKKQQSGKTNLKLLLVSVCAFCSMALFSFLFYTQQSAQKMYELPNEYKDWYVLAIAMVDVDNNGKEDRLLVIADETYGIERTNKIILFQKNDWRELLFMPLCGFMGWEMGDFNKNGKLELLTRYDDFGMAGWQSWYLYEWKNNAFELLASDSQILSALEVKNLDNDDLLEIIQTFWPGEVEPKVKQIFKWNNQTQKYFLQKTIETNEF